MNKDITARYSIQHFFYWAGYCGIFSYGIAFLTGNGLSASVSGFILFCANFCSFLIQPFIASFADKAKKNVLQKIMITLGFIAIGCFCFIYFVRDISPIAFCTIYVIGSTFYDMEQGFLNSENAYYAEKGWKTGYGLGRAVGAVSYGIISLVVGNLISKFGVYKMFPVEIPAIGLFIVSCYLMPKEETKTKTEENESLSLLEFFVRYKWYSISLSGILLIAMVHLMLENYLIKIVTPLGGNSSNVGFALFIATLGETVGLLFSSKIHTKLGSWKMFLVAGFFYIVKALLFFFAKSILAIYVGEFLQIVTYTFLSPAQMFFAAESTKPKDMIKGQATSTSAFAIGAALGNLLGGILITFTGLKGMLLFAAFVATLGFVILFVCVPKTGDKT